MTHTVMHISGLTKSRGVRCVLDAVSLELQPGRVTAILGPSGAGKSTLLRAIAGLEDCDAGTISVPGEILTDGRVLIRPEHRNIGMVFQDFSLFPHLSIIENVMFGLRAGPVALRKNRATEMLEQVQLGSRANDYPHMLSGGEQQRVALARALAPAPSIVLLDEAFSGLDKGLRAQLRAIALKAIAAQGAAALMVTHDAEEAMYMADTLALMIDGRIVQSGTPTELYLRPVSAAAAGLLGDVNSYDGLVKDGTFVTPFGEIDASEMAEGPAQLLVRPEGVVITADPSAANTVKETHTLGANQALTIETPTSLRWTVRAPIELAIPAGQMVRTSLNPAFCQIIARQLQ